MDLVLGAMEASIVAHVIAKPLYALLVDDAFPSLRAPEQRVRALRSCCLDASVGIAWAIGNLVARSGQRTSVAPVSLTQVQGVWPPIRAIWPADTRHATEQECEKPCWAG